MSNINNKKSYVETELAKEFLLLTPGDSLQSISYYEERFNVSRGTVQKAIKALGESGAVKIETRGRNGSFIQEIDYAMVQEYYGIGTIIGCLTMPASITTKGLITALYNNLNILDCNIVYARNAEIRIKMLKKGKCDFTVCSLHSALLYSKNQNDIKILFNFGPYTYTSERIKIFRDSSKTDFDTTMRIAYDSENDDYVGLMNFLLDNNKKYNLVETKTQRILKALRDNLVDAGMWSIDDAKTIDMNLGIAKITTPDVIDYTTAVLLVRSDDFLTQSLLEKYINISRVIKTQYEVVNGLREPDY